MGCYSWKVTFCMIYGSLNQIIMQLPTIHDYTDHLGRALSAHRGRRSSLVSQPRPYDYRIGKDMHSDKWARPRTVCGVELSFYEYWLTNIMKWTKPLIDCRQCKKSVKLRTVGSRLNLYSLHKRIQTATSRIVKFQCQNITI